MKKRKFAEGGGVFPGDDFTPMPIGYPEQPVEPPFVTPPTPISPPPRGIGGSGKQGGTARGGLDLVGQGAKTVSGALDDIQARIGGGGGLGSMVPSPGMTGMKKGGAVKGYAKGGMVGAASRRADGIAQRGKTKGRMI